MNENTIKYKLNRIEDATDRIRVKVGVTTGPIEDVASAVENTESISDYFNLNSTKGTGEHYGWVYSIKKIPKITNKLSSYYYYFRTLPSGELDVSGIDTSIATNLCGMFYGNSLITSLDLRHFNTDNVTDMEEMFCRCTSLQFLDIRNFNFTKVTRYSNMFYYVPNDCLIIVKDETAKTWITSKFTNLTNVKTVAEYEGN